MTILQAFLLGLIQGLTELLPISSSIASSVDSSGHLLLLQNILGVQNFSIWIKLFLHIGTLTAVVGIYWHRLLNMIRHPVRSDLWLLVVATVPAIAASLLTTFDDAFAMEYIGWSFLITTLILWFGDLIASVAPQGKQVKWYHAMFMGIMQGIAMMLPGVSRTASAIAGGSATGLARRDAVDFSLLMLAPPALLSIAFAAKDLLAHPVTYTEGPLVALTAFASSAAFGCLAILLIRALVRRIKLSWFGLYTGIIGVLVLMDQYFFHFFF